MENPQEVITECLSKFCTPDYIMEPGIFTQLKRLAAQRHIAIDFNEFRLIFRTDISKQAAHRSKSSINCQQITRQ